MRILIFLLLIIAGNYAYAQIPAPINSSKIYENYISLIKKEKKEEALEELNKVDRNDTNYIAILSEKCELLLEMEKYDELIACSNEGLNVSNTFQHNFYNIKGVAYLRKNMHQEALAIFEEALKKFPKYYLLMSNKGAALKELKRYPEALEAYKETVRLNPYWSSGHLSLAILAANEGLVTQAMLAFNTFLILEPKSSKSLAVLKRMSEIISSNYEKAPISVPFAPAGGDDFSDIDLIVTNYTALGKNYKIPVKTELNIIKQNHAILSKLEYNKNDKGFWMQTYVPLYREIQKQNMFEAFSYYIIQSSGNEAHMKLVSKNQVLINKFKDWVYPLVGKMNYERETIFDGEKKVMQHYFHSKSRYLETIGNLNSEGNLNGPVEFYNGAGTMISKGNFVNGKKTGTWKYYYYTGALHKEFDYNNGKVDGPFKIYHENGKISKTGKYVDDKQQEEQKVYNQAGILSEEMKIKDHQQHGKFTYYHEVGQPYISFVGNYNTGKLHDTLIEYYSTGEMLSAKVFNNGLVNGDHKVYYRNGQLKSKATYVNDLREGEYKKYYPDGKLSEEGTYKANSLAGTIKQYRRTGFLESEYQYDEKGKKNGFMKYYDTDGKIYYELTYNKGEITAYKYYDKTGKVIKEAKKEKGEFLYHGFFPDGTKRAEGIYTADGEKGLWKYYDKYGNLNSEQEYVKGLANGKIKRYHENGKLYTDETYKNGELDGYYVSYFVTGNKRSEGWYVNGKRHGYWHYYFRNGELKSKEYYVKGKQSGYQQDFSISGKLENEEYFEDDVLIRTTYFDSTGTKINTIELPEGTGNYQLFYTNKQLRFSGNYITSIAHGEFAWYYFDGKLRTKGKYHNGKRTGKWTWYSEDGKIEKEGFYEDGKETGEWKTYHASGKLKKVDFRIEDELEGDVKYYYENGQLEIVKKYADDVEQGEAYYYDENNELQMIRTSLNGKVISYTYNDAAGKLKEPIKVDGANYKVVAYYKNGNKSREYEVVNGMYQGKYIEYYSNGKIKDITEYKDDNMTGKYLAYYPDGKVQAEINYYDGVLHGPSKYYYANGNLEKELMYYMDYRHGDSKFYNNAGKLIKTRKYYSDVCIKETNH
ncbi:MAG: hypothetical protein ACK40G_02930 [Cytophagaceae bacterium]